MIQKGNVYFVTFVSYKISFVVNIFIPFAKLLQQNGKYFMYMGEYRGEFMVFQIKQLEMKAMKKFRSKANEKQIDRQTG